MVSFTSYFKQNKTIKLIFLRDPKKRTKREQKENKKISKREQNISSFVRRFERKGKGQKYPF